MLTLWGFKVGASHRLHFLLLRNGAVLNAGPGAAAVELSEHPDTSVLGRSFNLTSNPAYSASVSAMSSQLATVRDKRREEERCTMPSAAVSDLPTYTEVASLSSSESLESTVTQIVDGSSQATEAATRPNHGETPAMGTGVFIPKVSAPRRRRSRRLNAKAKDPEGAVHLTSQNSPPASSSLEVLWTSIDYSESLSNYSTSLCNPQSATLAPQLFLSSSSAPSPALARSSSIAADGVIHQDDLLSLLKVQHVHVTATEGYRGSSVEQNGLDLGQQQQQQFRSSLDVPVQQQQRETLQQQLRSLSQPTTSTQPLVSSAPKPNPSSSSRTHSFGFPQHNTGFPPNHQQQYKRYPRPQQHHLVRGMSLPQQQQPQQQPEEEHEQGQLLLQQLTDSQPLVNVHARRQVRSFDQARPETTPTTTSPYNPHHHQNHHHHHLQEVAPRRASFSWSMLNRSSNPNRYQQQQQQEGEGRCRSVPLVYPGPHSGALPPLSPTQNHHHRHQQEQQQLSNPMPLSADIMYQQGHRATRRTPYPPPQQENTTRPPPPAAAAAASGISYLGPVYPLPAAVAAAGRSAYQSGTQQQQQQQQQQQEQLQEQLLLNLLEKQTPGMSSAALYPLPEDAAAAAALALTPLSTPQPPFKPCEGAFNQPPLSLELRQLSPQLHHPSPELHPLSPEALFPAAATNAAAVAAGAGFTHMVMDRTTGVGGFGAGTAPGAAADSLTAVPHTGVDLQQLLQQMLLQHQQQQEEEERSLSLPLVCSGSHSGALPPLPPLHAHHHHHQQQQQQEGNMMINISSRSSSDVSSGYLLSADQLSEMLVRQMTFDQQQQEERQFQAQQQQQEQELRELRDYRAQLELELDQTLQAMQQINNSNSELMSASSDGNQQPYGFF